MTTNNLEEKACLNCGERISSTYCAYCGQKDLDLNVSFGHLAADFLGDIFSYDSRVFRTLMPLISKPGLLTQQYNLGQRVRYVPPVRLFIIISLLYFFALSLTGVEDNRIVFTTHIHQDEADTQEQKTFTGFNLNTEIDGSQEQVEPYNPDDYEGGGVVNLFVRKVMAARENREQIVAAVFEWMPRLMFILIPVFAFILKVFYRKSGKYYVHHLVFGLHYHSFLFLLLFLLLPFSNLFDNLTDKIVMIIAPLYLFMSMRRVYAESLPKTLIKCLTISISYLFVFTVSTITTLIAIIMLQD